MGWFGGRKTRVLAAASILALAGSGCEGQGAGGRPGGASGPLDDTALTALIDSILPSIADASGLDVRYPVQSAVQSREAARAFIDRQLDDELGPEELAGTERTYRALGLLPDTVDLRALLLDLYTEQVVGYYDPASDRLYVVEGVSADSAAPVVAHELVHALQDQLVDLDSLVARERGNDRQLAAQAAAEGQATFVMIALQAAEAAGEPVDPSSLPDLAALLAPALEAQNEQFPVFRRAPRIIRETLLFPYLGGAAFVQQLQKAGGAGGAGAAGAASASPAVPVPFGDLLPQSTEQVIDPAGRFLGERDAPTELELGDAAGGWRVAYGNTLGQYELGVFLSEHLGEGARAAASGWDGDRYALLDGPAGEEALAWYSVWDTAGAADRFAHAYRRILDGRPGRVGTVERVELDGRPGVKVVDAPAGVDPSAVGAPQVLGLDEAATR